MPAPTGIDYYQALAIPKTASREQIQKGYRATALKTHPLKTASDATQHAKTLAQVNFQNAAEAYQVLSDPKLRAIYDQYGLDGLKVGVPAHGDFEGYKGHYEFNGNAEEVFELFFGSNNPFQDFNPPSAQADGSLPSAYYGEAFQHLDGMVSSMIPGRGPTQDQAREIPVEVSLEELFAGATKKLTYKRQVLQADKSTLKEEEHTLTVEVNPGAAEGTKITFARQGDQGIKKIATDIVAVLKQIPHPHFQREGQNLVYKHAITLEKALTGSTVSVPLLAGRSVNISLQEIISPTYRKVVAGEGLPLPWVNGQPQVDAKSGDVLCGDLILTFDVTFPTYLSVKQKEIIKQVFAASS